ncbi:hypothetical protein GCM10023149_17580 [Mucilaginibacter gynuensis]|uniref:Ppx/GppA phosphatase N-terminal domain-containing protein n=1 Tax=Mucilaginibacter gynuensis TaxID=1302236 RepID=A0ABP8G8F5_9SPHI
MNKRVAVMDLGTNTFHLLIAEGTITNYHELIHEHIAVKLGEGGINKGFIQPEAFQRGLDTMQLFQRDIEAHNVTEVRAIATSMLRNAANGTQFINEVAKLTGISIEIIDGDAEANFIYQGVKAGDCLSAGNVLIIDIGGGSVEFILGNDEYIIWKQSFEIGAARLMDKFHKSDPIPQASIDELNNYLEDKLKDMLTAVAGYEIGQLIGSSGSFETLAEVVEQAKGRHFDLKTTKNYLFENDDLIAATDKLINSSHAERKANKAIIPIRVDMIVVASLITRFVMRKLAIGNVLMSTNSLKEGVLTGMLD